MKKVFVIILIVVLALLLIPERGQMKDGGTVVYNAVLYDVYLLHRINPAIDSDQAEFITGTVVYVFGFEIFNNTEPYIDIHN